MVEDGHLARKRAVKKLVEFYRSKIFALREDHELLFCNGELEYEDFTLLMVAIKTCVNIRCVLATLTVCTQNYWLLNRIMSKDL